MAWTNRHSKVRPQFLRFLLVPALVVYLRSTFTSQGFEAEEGSEKFWYHPKLKTSVAFVPKAADYLHGMPTAPLVNVVSPDISPGHDLHDRYADRRLLYFLHLPGHHSTPVTALRLEYERRKGDDFLKEKPRIPLQTTESKL